MRKTAKKMQIHERSAMFALLSFLFFSLSVTHLLRWPLRGKAVEMT